MKIRNGFVSNSSSSSFTIKKKYLKKFQICAIRHHLEFGRLLGIEYSDDECDRWEVVGLKDENSKKIFVSTSMTNFGMKEFLRKIGVPDEAIGDEEDYG